MKYFSFFILFSFFASISSVRSDTCEYKGHSCERSPNYKESNSCFLKQLIKNKFECTIIGGDCCALHECVNGAKRDKDNICKCEVNRYQLGNICKECPSGYYSKYGAKANTECYRNCIKDDVLNCAEIDKTNPGTIYYPGSTKPNECSCDKCMKGYYKDNNKCTQCPDNFRDGEGVNYIDQCVANVPDGKYLTKNGELYECPPGYYCEGKKQIKYGHLWRYNEEKTKKICDPSYPNSSSGAKSSKDCYTSCEEKQGIKNCKTYLKDKYYSNDTEGNNKCECSECINDFILKDKKTCEWRIYCTEGTFLPKNKDRCVLCLTEAINSKKNETLKDLSEQERIELGEKIKNSYCPEGYFVQQPYDQGIESCPSINVEDPIGTYLLKSSISPEEKTPKSKKDCYVEYYSYNDRGCIQKYKKKYNEEKKEISEQCVIDKGKEELATFENIGKISCYLKNKKCVPCDKNNYLNGNNCSKCPVGMKSKEGSSSINDCKYTKDTKFCFDNTKCFTIQELGDLETNEGKYQDGWKVVY